MDSDLDTCNRYETFNGTYLGAGHIYAHDQNSASIPTDLI